MFAALATTMGFTSCDESKDDHPVLQPNDGVVVEDFLNIPELSNTAVAITEDNKGQTFHLTCSQPSYGFAAQAAYTVEVSLSPDFATPAVEGCPAYEALATPYYDCAEIDPPYSELALAMSDLLGIESNDQVPTAYYDVYARLVANIETVSAEIYPNTTYMSNVVKLTQASVQYLAIVIPDLPTGIYLRGGWDLSWAALPDYEFKTTDVNGVYYIESVSIAEGTEFKVADASWGEKNFGGTTGQTTTITIGESFELNTDPANGGPGNLVMPADFTGRVTLTNKGDAWTLLFEAAEPDTPGQSTGVYLRGGWDANWDALPAYEFKTSEVKNIWYVENLTIAAGTEFKVADSTWGSVNLGCGEEPFEIGKAFTLVSGGGNIVCPEAFTGKAEYKVQGGKTLLTLIAE